MPGADLSGKIIFAWLRDELRAPTMPSNWFQCTNP